MPSFSQKSLHLTAYEQAFVFPHAITALGSTPTKFRISSKDLIDFLIEYDPVLPDDPHHILSHNYEVANVQRIVTAPALLKPTSLDFAFGLDMPLTRVAPSNTFEVLSGNFNNARLV
ncbi:hypothetical protein K443DRAFT_109800 [Laccaria amethystina LaAM-08-1]|uniref:ER membrane protein complex subunit 1 n=1 Tax=Laccaria amethystina LaAM-08-1 TaxID=1095629 RepID=A0A0C9X0E7_9AGAR|nr:hypothetical protein K443DRAFT_109800 [Laccaria amethystina LaAM-08-1]